MKFIILALMAFGFSNFAGADSIESPGNVIYKMPNGEIVKRAVKLRVPSRGQGDVVLIGQQELVADRFFSKQVAGRTVFVVVFSDFPGSSEGQKSVFRGTYLRGSNKAIYYGNVFIVTREEVLADDEKLVSFLNDENNAQYAAGFYFSSDIE